MSLTEKDFQRQVIELAELNGFLVYHTHDSRKSAKGFPDLVMARTERVVFAELKTEKGLVSREQWLWLAALPNAYVWRPSDWNAIVKILKRH